MSFFFCFCRDMNSWVVVYFELVRLGAYKVFVDMMIMTSRSTEGEKLETMR